MKPLSAWLFSTALIVVGTSLSAVASAKESPAHDKITVTGLDAPAEILIDRWGVPHIYAKSAKDAFFVQGWNAARDRLWQIDLWRRSGRGELASVLGEAYLAKDAATRLFVFRGEMKDEWAAYGAEAEESGRAFVAGINGFVEATRINPSLLPKEFGLLGYTPAIWETDDLVRVRNHTLAFSAIFQADRAKTACKEGAEAKQILPAISPPWEPRIPKGLDLCSIPSNVLDTYLLARAPVTFTADTANSAAKDDVEKLAAQLVQAANQGSNNWVVAPSKSATGGAILANDPHLGMNLPSSQYIAHMSAPGLNVIGAWHPASPGILIGHNENVALGATLFAIAQEDIYVYDINRDNPNEYRYNNAWVPMRTVTETITVKGKPDQKVTLKFTRHGPVVMEDTTGHKAYAVRASWLEAGGAPFLGSLRYLRSRNVDELAGHLKHWRGIGLNIVAADTSGKIAWLPSGGVPKRSNTDGLFPLPGDGRYEWDGYLDNELLPSETNPDRGYIATANQMNLPKDYAYDKHPIGFFWIDNSRFKRISEVLDALPKVSVQDSEKLQNDHLALPARRLVPLLKLVKTTDSDVSETIRWLSDWNGDTAVESPQAALYGVWITHHLTPSVIERVAPTLSETTRKILSTLNISEIIDILEAPTERLGADPIRARDAMLTDTLKVAIAETRTTLGPDRSKWQWGQLSKVHFQHQLSPAATADQQKLMDLDPAPKAGEANSVGVAQYDAKTFRTTGGATFRMVLDVADWDKSVAVNAPGQSGDWASEHYKDLFPLWLSGRYFPLLFSRSSIEKETARRIELIPGGQ